MVWYCDTVYMISLKSMFPNDNALNIENSFEDAIDSDNDYWFLMLPWSCWRLNWMKWVLYLLTIIQVTSLHAFQRNLNKSAKWCRIFRSCLNSEDECRAEYILGFNKWVESFRWQRHTPNFLLPPSLPFSCEFVILQFFTKITFFLK